MVTQFDTQAVKLHSYKGSKPLNGTKKFESGNDIIDSFVRKNNLKSQGKAPGTTVFVLVDNSNNNSLVGFCTLACHSLSKDMFSTSKENIGKTSSIPVVKLGMIGVDKQYQKRGFGEDLVLEALKRTKIVCEQAGCSGLFLIADPGAITFYKKLGFSELELEGNTPQAIPMFLHVDCIP